ncbi:NACHT, LRR and PYD domains-containing protein 3-like isoform X17 [Alosa pseudoharengus]|uniref:NACHT, LRR and PYD domains-containing protein 3-like isoform X17 n=1 Tax=Alosa pseudoharengus TaxID=34774 RepID=UPI003F8A126A
MESTADQTARYKAEHRRELAERRRKLAERYANMTALNSKHTGHEQHKSTAPDAGNTGSTGNSTPSEAGDGALGYSSHRKSFHYERPPSPVPISVSMKSDRSEDRFIGFKCDDVTAGSRSYHYKRPPSPVPTAVSLKSDRSEDRFIGFKHGDVTDGSRSYKRPPSPVPTAVSLKSDRSEDRFIGFKHGDVTDGSRGQMEGCKSEAVSDQITQGDLKHIFELLEEKIITFVKNELRRFKKILSPDYQENFEGKEQDESDVREGALKIALHFLRNMKQKHIADKLQENERDVVCQTKLKRNLKNKYQSVFEGIPKQGSSALLEKIYTEVYITEGGSGKVNEEHEVRQIESISNRPARQETSIKCRDIFKPLPGQDQPIRSVITKGVAGIGKTVSVQKYILDWAERKENQDVHFIFPLPFRELNPLKDKMFSLMKLLHHFFSEMKQLTFPSQEKYKVLFIFDGLDECRLPLDFQKNEVLTEVTKASSLDVLLTNVIQGNLLPSALLWVTSRPAAANQIPPDCVDRVTEVQGFSDPQKEEYFRKRICDQTIANKVFSHIKSSKSLHIMCHIPVFCWIAATVLEFLLKTEGCKEVPKTLTEMYTHFLVFQTKQRSLKLEGVYDIDPQWNRASLLALGKLAYEQLVKGNLIFYEDDLRESHIDVTEAAVHCGICTQIFREESGLHQEKLYCFVHLSIQEYLAALYVMLMFITERMDLMTPKQATGTVIQILTQRPANKSMTTLHKSAVDKALKHEDGRFDLFLRFLLGLSLESNQRLLRGLLQKVQDEGKEEIASYIKTKIREIPSSERVINLFHCLNEINDHSLVKEVQSFLSAGTLSEAKLSSTQWSALVFVLVTSEEKLDVFDLKKYIRSDECLLRLQPVVEESQKALLNSCRLTERSCAGLASLLTKASSKLKHLDLSYNSIGDIGVQELCSGLGDPNCALETLRLSECSITEKGYASLASALRSNPKHLRELDLRGNDTGKSGVKLLLDLKEDPQCTLTNVQFLRSSAAEEACAAVASAVGSNPLLMTELDLSGRIPGVLGVTQLCALLQDPHCTLQRLRLENCSIGEEGFRALASALRSNPSHMRQLRLNENKTGDSGVKHLSSLLEDPNCKLETLYLENCSIGEEGFRALASALRSNPSHMRVLWLGWNDAGDSGVKHLSSLLEDPNCKLDKLGLENCSIGEEGFRALASALRSNPSRMRQLWLSGNKAGDSGVKHLSSLLEDPNCKLEKLYLSDCSIGEEGFRALTSALRSNPSHMRQLWLRENKAGDSGVKHLSSLLEDPNCKLEKLYLSYCSIGEEGFRALASALRLNPSHMRELWLSGNKAGDSGVKHLSSLLEDPNCKLETLYLQRCSITDEGFRALASALRSNPSALRELHLKEYQPGPSAQQLLSELQKHPNCKLLKVHGP